MIYACDNCGFLFSRTSETEQCPDCGKNAVRAANAIEQEEFMARLSGVPCDESSAPFPDIVETDIEEVDCFRFKLPVTALQIDSPTIMEIVVEHGISPVDQNTAIANVWARPVDGTLSGFLMPLHIPSNLNEPTVERAGRIVAALNESDLFMEQLHKFVVMMMNAGN